MCSGEELQVSDMLNFHSVLLITAKRTLVRNWIYNVDQTKRRNLNLDSNVGMKNL